MTTQIWRPPKALIVPKLDSYVKLDLAFGLGTGSKLFDKSKYRAHGDISGASWAAGNHGYALDFTAATPDYVSIAAAYDQLDFTTESFSIISRVYAESLPGIGQIICRGRGNVNGYYYFVRSTGQLGFATNVSGAFDETKSSAGDITTGSWFTIGLTREGTSVNLYVNGVDVTASSGTHEDPVSSSYDCTLGVYYNLTSEQLDGMIEFLRVYGGIALPAKTHLAFHNALK